MLIRGAWNNLIKAETYGYSWEAYQSYDSMYDQIYHIQKSNKAYEKDTTAIGSGPLHQKPEGGDIREVDPAEGWTVYGRNWEWAKMVKVTKEIAEDAIRLKNFLKSMVPDWTNDVEETKEEFFANAFNYGGYTAGHEMFDASIPGGALDDPSGDLIYDSKPLFTLEGNERTTKGGGTYYNAIAESFSKSALQDAYTLATLTNAVKENDTKRRQVVDTVYASPALMWDIREILDSPDAPETANRAKNTAYQLVKYIENPYLTNTTQWTLLKAKDKGLIALMREIPEFDMWEDKKKKCYMMSVYTRFGIMVKDWRKMVSSNASTSA